jgi:hypothetical protein
MSDQQATPDRRDTPEQRQRVVRTLLILSPLMFVFCLALAGIQGASMMASLVIAFVAIVMCLGAAGLYAIRGGQSKNDISVIDLILDLFRR